MQKGRTFLLLLLVAASVSVSAVQNGFQLTDNGGVKSLALPETLSAGPPIPVSPGEILEENGAEIVAIPATRTVPLCFQEVQCVATDVRVTLGQNGTLEIGTLSLHILGKEFTFKNVSFDPEGHLLNNQTLTVDEEIPLWGSLLKIIAVRMYDDGFSMEGFIGIHPKIGENPIYCDDIRINGDAIRSGHLEHLEIAYGAFQITLEDFTFSHTFSDAKSELSFSHIDMQFTEGPLAGVKWAVASGSTDGYIDDSGKIHIGNDLQFLEIGQTTLTLSTFTVSQERCTFSGEVYLPEQADIGLLQGRRAPLTVDISRKDGSIRTRHIYIYEPGHLCGSGSDRSVNYSAYSLDYEGRDLVLYLYDLEESGTRKGTYYEEKHPYAKLFPVKGTYQWKYIANLPWETK